MSSQFVTTYRKQRPGIALPYAFTEQGVAMLSGVFRSSKAIKMNIAVMQAFVELRRILLKQGDVARQLTELRERLGEHDAQLSYIYQAIENLIDEQAYQHEWEERTHIGYKP